MDTIELEMKATGAKVRVGTDLAEHLIRSGRARATAAAVLEAVRGRRLHTPAAQAQMRVLRR